MDISPTTQFFVKTAMILVDEQHDTTWMHQFEGFFEDKSDFVYTLDHLTFPFSKNSKFKDTAAKLTSNSDIEKVIVVLVGRGKKKFFCIDSVMVPAELIVLDLANELPEKLCLVHFRSSFTTQQSQDTWMKRVPKHVMVTGHYRNLPKDGESVIGEFMFLYSALTSNGQIHKSFNACYPPSDSSGAAIYTEEFNENTTQKRTLTEPIEYQSKRKKDACVFHSWKGDFCKVNCRGRSAQFPKLFGDPDKAILEELFERKGIKPKQQLDFAVDFYEEKMAMEYRDFARSWGCHLLTFNDDAWRERSYLTNAFRYRQLNPLKTMQPYQVRMEDVENYLHWWKKLSPETTPFFLATHASDCINRIHCIASEALNIPAKSVGVMFLSNVFGASRGPMRGISFLKEYSESGFDFGNYVIEAPFYNKNTLFEKLTSQEEKLIKKKEDESLKKIRRLVKDKNARVLFLELIPGAAGVQFARPEYLKRLRLFCDRYSVLIFADEALTGCRTGKFFSYEHYQHIGFYPDFVIFGKGLIMCGIACVDRPTPTDVEQSYSGRKNQEPVLVEPKLPQKWSEKFGLKNVQCNPITLLQSTQLLKRIFEGDLLQHSATIGKYFVEKLLEIDVQEQRTPSHKTRGIGLLIWTEIDLNVRMSMCRIHPPLTLTKQHIDQVVEEYIQLRDSNWTCKKYCETRCYCCNEVGDKLTLCKFCPRAYHTICLPKDAEITMDPPICEYCCRRKQAKPTNTRHQVTDSKLELATNQSTNADTSFEDL